MGAQVGILSNNQWPAPFDGSMYSNSGRNLKTWWMFEDFIQGISAGAQTTSEFISQVGGAAANLFDDVGLSTRPGILNFYTGTTATGYATLFCGRGTQAPFLFGGGTYTFETEIMIPTLSAVAEEYIIRIGFGDVLTGADFVDGAYFEYDRLTNVNWLRCTALNSARTKTDTAIAVGAGAWIRLKIIVNPPGTQVDFYINNVLVGSNVANIPVGAGRNTSVIYNVIKSAGVTPRFFYLDWTWLHFDLTASR